MNSTSLLSTHNVWFFVEFKVNYSLNFIREFLKKKKKKKKTSDIHVYGKNKLLLSAKFDNCVLSITFVDLNLDLKQDIYVTINSISLTDSANIWDKGIGINVLLTFNRGSNGYNKRCNYVTSIHYQTQRQIFDMCD